MYGTHIHTASELGSAKEKMKIKIKMKKKREKRKKFSCSYCYSFLPLVFIILVVVLVACSLRISILLNLFVVYCSSSCLEITPHQDVERCNIVFLFIVVLVCKHVCVCVRMCTYCCELFLFPPILVCAFNIM